MTFTYPIEIAKDLVAVTNAFSQQSMEIHGTGLVRHLVRHRRCELLMNHR